MGDEELNRTTPPTAAAIPPAETASDESSGKLRVPASHYREFAERAGNPAIRDIRRRTAEYLDKAAYIERRRRSEYPQRIIVPRGRAAAPRTELHAAPVADAGPDRHGAILVIDDDPALRQALQFILAAYGHRTASAATGSAALSLVISGRFRPDVIISDYMLPGGMNGARTVEALRATLARQLPVVFLTGDLSSAALSDTDLADSVTLAKPVKPNELLRNIQKQLITASPRQGGTQAGR